MPRFLSPVALFFLLHSPQLTWAQPSSAPSSQPNFSSAPSPQPSSSSVPSLQPADDDDDEIEEIEDTDVEQIQIQGPQSFWSEDYPLLDRGINLPLAAVSRPMSLRLIVDHRTNQPVNENTWHDYFGFDAGSLKIGLGLRFGIISNLDVGLYRLNSATEAFDLYQLDAKYQFLSQERQMLNLALRAGMTWFSQENADDALGALAQLIIDRRFFHRLTIGTGLLFHSDSTNGIKSSADKDWSLATMLVITVRIIGSLAWNAEAAFNLAGYGTRDKKDSDGADLTSYPSFSTGLTILTHRHTFAIVVSNNPYVSTDGYVCNSPRGFDKLIVGFTITREWNF